MVIEKYFKIKKEENRVVSYIKCITQTLPITYPMAEQPHFNFHQVIKLIKINKQNFV